MTATKDQPNVFAFTNGPRNAKIILVGEAWGYDEARAQQPFVGYSGQELNRILSDAGLRRADILCTNLVDAQPIGNDFARFLNPASTKKADISQRFRDIDAKRIVVEGHAKLLALIDQVKPQLIIGAGNWPLWALTSHATVSTSLGFRKPSGIMNWRGSQTLTEPIHGQRYPYLPIIHPAAITRDMSLRHITCHDLRFRAKRKIQAAGGSGLSCASWSPQPRPIKSSGRFTESYAQLRAWLDRAEHGDSLELCCDVETWRRSQLVVVGLCDGRCALVTPFFYFDEEGRMIDCFTLRQEQVLKRLIYKLLQHPKVSVINQNYSYDWQYLNRFLDITKHVSFDTMLAHHLLFPGTPKSLDYLASMYSNDYLFWKNESQDWAAKGDHQAMWDYNGKDTWYTWEIAQVLKAVIAKTGRQEQYDFQIRQWSLYTDVMQHGCNWDAKRSLEMRTDLIQIASSLENKLLEAMPEDLRYTDTGKPWYDSPKHQQYIFYDRLGIQPVKHKKTKKPTLDKESFETLIKRAPWLAPIFNLMKFKRSVDVYARNFLNVGLGLDRRMHSSFNVGGPETFRLSSSSNAFDEGMNLQNLPKKED